jgi:hypothetical protein
MICQPPALQSIQAMVSSSPQALYINNGDKGTFQQSNMVSIVL